MKEHQIKFLNMAIEVNALMFGDFTLKSGRKSPYFFNIASFIQSGHLSDLVDLYVREIINNQKTVTQHELSQIFNIKRSAFMLIAFSLLNYVDYDSTDNSLNIQKD